MTCKKFGWKGHRYIKGVCACGLNKAEVKLEEFKRKTLANSEPYDLAPIKFMGGAIFIGITMFLVWPFLSGIINDITAPAIVNENGEPVNGTVDTPFSSVPKWPFMIVFLTMTAVFVFKFLRLSDDYL